MTKKRLVGTWSLMSALFHRLEAGFAPFMLRVTHQKPFPLASAISLHSHTLGQGSVFQHTICQLIPLHESQDLCKAAEAGDCAALTALLNAGAKIHWKDKVCLTWRPCLLWSSYVFETLPHWWASACSMRKMQVYGPIMSMMARNPNLQVKCFIPHRSSQTLVCGHYWWACDASCCTKWCWERFLLLSDIVFDKQKFRQWPYQLEGDLLDT